MADKRTCSVDGCGIKMLARGYCEAHYRRVLETGDPQVHIPVTEYSRFASPEEELSTRSSFHCAIEWDGPVDDNGFGIMSTKLRPHRVVWERAHGETLGRRRLMHLCGNRRCLTVDHLALARGKKPRLCRVPGCGQPLFDSTHCEDHWDMQRKGETWVSRLGARLTKMASSA